MAPAPSLILEKRVLACHCLGSPPKRGNNFPSCVPGILQIFAFTLTDFILAVLCTCVLSKAGRLGLKTPNFMDFAWHGPIGSSGGGFCHSGVDVGLPKRTDTPKHRGWILE